MPGACPAQTRLQHVCRTASELPLEQAGIVLKCKRLDNAEIPLEAYADLSAFKLYMSDVGMLTMKSRLPAETVLANQGSTFLGALAENYAAQQLSALGLP
ncbi:MAG: DUF4143 domain-containing protein, partial [Desulfovibrio sp.]|nr:DUF4143 domain-containing protein [Desulfovibrio sp.]